MKGNAVDGTTFSKQIDLEDYFAFEPLHPELEARLDRSPVMPAIRHPLVISLAHHERLNKIANRRFEQAKRRLAAAAIDKDWHRYVFTHERPWRFKALMEVAGRAGSEFRASSEFWKLVGAVWQNSENIHESFGDWHEVWSASGAQRLAAMDADDQAAWAALPDTVPIWRGASHKGVAAGLSWTLDRAKAAWFARRPTGHPDRLVPFVAAGAVQKARVLAFFGGQGEKEVVVLPEYVEGVSVRRLRRTAAR